MADPQAMHTSVKEFVDPKVHTIPLTDQIIADIMPFLPKTARVVSGYLNEDELYWKINFHWEYMIYMIYMIDYCLTLDLADKHKKSLEAIKTALNTNIPDPPSGYRLSQNIGEPVDKSSHETILARYKIVAQGKLDFAAIVKAAGIDAKLKAAAAEGAKSTATPRPKPPPTVEQMALAYARLASPQQGNHKTGYALDISNGGNNQEIVRIVKSLGGTAFDEKSHVHCEWKNGVDKSQMGGGGAAARVRSTQVLLDSGNQNVRHCQLRAAE